MTSTTIQVGLPEDHGHGMRRGNQSARGRTHTDIFGISDQAETAQKKNVVPPSSEQNVMEDEKKGNENKEEKEKEQEKDKDIEDTNGVKENKTEANPVEVPKTQRVRMPPGGFSSGLCFQMGSHNTIEHKRNYNPLGHTHSDIFGIFGYDQPSPSKISIAPLNHMKDLLDENSRDEINRTKDDIEIPDENGNKDDETDSGDSPTQVARIHVPPGGYASEFW